MLQLDIKLKIQWAYFAN